MLLLNSNGLAIQQLRQHNHLQDLQNFCLTQVNKFLKPRQQQNPAGEGFAIIPVNVQGLDAQLRAPQSLGFNSIEPFMSLLLSLLIINDCLIEHSQNQQHEHLLAEFLAYFYRTAIDRPQSLLQAEDVKLSLRMIGRALKEQVVYQKNKEEIIQVMEVLSLFTWHFQRQNQGLVDLLMNNNGGQRMLAEQSTRISLSLGGGGLHSQQNSTAPQLILMNKNLLDLQLSQVFEEGILDLVRMESTLDTSFQETSASINFLNSLLRYMQSLRKNDDLMGPCIHFKLRLIDILVKSYGRSNDSIKQALQTLTHKLVKSFDFIFNSNEERDIIKILSLLFTIVLKELAREDLTVFLMQEIQKIFKKVTYNSLMAEALLQMAKIPQALKDNKTNMQIFNTIVSIINQLWHDQQIDDLSNENFLTLLNALGLCLEKIDISKGNNHSGKSFNAHHNPKLFQHFVQMWIVIFCYLTEHENSKFNFRPQLIKLASLTPYLVYIQEFSLMLRIGHNKDVLERFITVSFQKFPGLTQGLAGQAQAQLTTQQREALEAKKQHIRLTNQAQNSKQTQSAIEIQDDEEDGEEEDELAFGEKLFLSLFAQIQEYRMLSLSSVSDRLLITSAHPNNFVESLLTVYVNDKLDQELFITKIDKLTSDLFDIYLANLKEQEQDSQKELILVQDFTFLLKSSCHLQKRLSSKSKTFLQSYIDHYPFLLLKPKVLSTLLDILDALNREMYHSYDSLSHAIRLPTTGEQIFLQTRQDLKQEILQELANLCQDMYVYAVIVQGEELNLSFEAYKVKLNEITGANGSMRGSEMLGCSEEVAQSHENHFGISFFEYLRANLDLTRADLTLIQSTVLSVDNQLPLNFHTFKNLAFAKPWKFVKAVEELKKTTPNGLFSATTNNGGTSVQQQSAFHVVFNIAKKSQQSQIDRLLTLKPFANPQQTSTLKKEATAHQLILYQTEIDTRISSCGNGGGNAYVLLTIYKELEGKLKKLLMQLDMYQAVKQLLRVSSKEAVYQILRQLTSRKDEKKMHLKSMIYGNRSTTQQKSSLAINTPTINSMLINRNLQESILYQGMPFTVRDNQKLGKTLQKLVHQVNRKQFLADLTQKLHHTLGLLVALLCRLPQNFNDKTTLSWQIVQLITMLPALCLSRESIQGYVYALDLLKLTSSDDSLLFIEILPLSIQIAASKIQPLATQYVVRTKIKAFELVNQMKSDFSEINEDIGLIQMINELMNSEEAQFDGYNNDKSETFLRAKFNSNWKQEQNQKSFIKYLNVILSQIQKQISAKALTQDTKILDSLAKVYFTLLENLQKAIFKASSMKGFTKLSLTLIKTGFQLIDAFKLRWRSKATDLRKQHIAKMIVRLQNTVYSFTMRYLQNEQLNAHTLHNLELKEQVQLLEDVKYLFEADSISLNPTGSFELLQLLTTMNKVYSESSKLLLPLSNLKSLYLSSKKTHPHKRSLVKFQDYSKARIGNSQGLIRAMTIKGSMPSLRDFKMEAMIAMYLLTYQKQTFFAWNYNEKMKDLKAFPQSQLDLPLFNEKVRLLISHYPKLAVQIYTKVGTSPKVLDLLRIPLSEDIVTRPQIYQYSTEALELYLDYIYGQGKKNLIREQKPIIAEWRCWHFVRMFKYLGFKYNGEYFYNQLALKPFEFVKSKTILQYLPQMFQSLRNDCQNQIQSFLIKKSKEFASVAHNVLWYCKVEAEPDRSKGRKVPLPLRENLHEVTVVLRENIVRHMTAESWQFFETETEFFERITSISGELMPKMSKDEKKAKIAQRLVEYNKSIPESVYLPTNTNCRVVGIVTTSGCPMQSAARVPILISFEVEEYPGPDNDPVLMSGVSHAHSSMTLQSTGSTTSPNINGNIQQNPSALPQNHLTPLQQQMVKSHSDFKLSVTGRQGSSNLKNPSILRKKNSARGSRHSHKIDQDDDDDDERLNNEGGGSIVLDDDSRGRIGEDEDEEEEMMIRPKENYENVEMVRGEEDGEDTESDQNVSPRSTPASQIAILNIKSRLQNYNFVTNRNEQKFSGTFIETLSQLKDLHQQQVPHHQKSLSLGLSHRVQPTNNNYPVEYESANFGGVNIEEQKINTLIQQEQSQPTLDEQYLLSQGQYVIQQNQQRLPKYQERMVSSMKAQIGANPMNLKNTTVSEIEQRKSIYKPILSEIALQGKRYHHPQQTPKTINYRRRKSVMIGATSSTNAATGGITQEFSPQKKGLQHVNGAGNLSANIRIVSCIFKVNDDLRQDIIALQVIKLFQKIFKKNDLDLFVAPYKCISNRTGDDKTLGGIIECVPNSHSRDQLGKAFEIDLYQYFLKKFGNEHTPEFKLARLNFIKSLSSYSVVSYILQIKDRHNGNIMIDDWGHIIHIDFGFIFDWSPGKDMRFESADFKLTKEFIDIMGGDRSAEAYQLFVTKTVQAYLSIREYYADFRNLIQLMYYSGFPCFKEQSLAKLEERFRLDLNVLEAANHMRLLINNAHDKWSTKFYDRIQYLQNKIVF